MFRLILTFLLISPILVHAQAKKTYSTPDTKRVYDEATGKEEIFRYVEIMPVPPYDINGYLSENIKYPVAAIDSNIEGRVIVKFVVDTVGNITDVTTVKSVHPLLDAEAERVVKSMPKWKPGSQKGKPVNVYYTLPIMFKLFQDDEEK